MEVFGHGMGKLMTPIRCPRQNSDEGYYEASTCQSETVLLVHCTASVRLRLLHPLD